MSCLLYVRCSPVSRNSLRLLLTLNTYISRSFRIPEMSFSHNNLPQPTSQMCYFSLQPNPSTHYSVETPACSPTSSHLEETPSDPFNPLLAYRPTSPEPSSRTRMDGSKLMSLQTSAAFPQARPKPQPIQQDVLHVSDNDSDDSINKGNSSSSSSVGLMSPQFLPEVARCSRCHRRPSNDVATGKPSMFQYGLNLWYCTRCANIVGFINR